MKLISNPTVNEVFDNYPQSVQGKMRHLRQMILSVASEIDGLENLEETLKWGEPAYLAKHGSTVRMDWKKKNPEQYAIYFKCTSRLVPTFKALYKDLFKYEDNRAIVFNLDDEVPESQLRHCISLALTYHKVKHLPLLGA